MRQVEILQAAERDIDEAFNWYEDQKADLGERFLEAVKSTVLRAAEQPDLYPTMHRDLRRVLVARFPFGVFFTSSETTLFVHAVFHSKRDPIVLWTR